MESDIRRINSRCVTIAENIFAKMKKKIREEKNLACTQYLLLKLIFRIIIWIHRTSWIINDEKSKKKIITTQHTTHHIYLLQMCKSWFRFECSSNSREFHFFLRLYLMNFISTWLLKSVSSIFLLFRLLLLFYWESSMQRVLLIFAYLID